MAASKSKKGKVGGEDGKGAANTILFKNSDFERFMQCQAMAKLHQAKEMKAALKLRVSNLVHSVLESHQYKNYAEISTAFRAAQAALKKQHEKAQAELDAKERKPFVPAPDPEFDEVLAQETDLAVSKLRIIIGKDAIPEAITGEDMTGSHWLIDWVE